MSLIVLPSPRYFPSWRQYVTKLAFIWIHGLIHENSASGVQYLPRLMRYVVMAAGLVSRSVDMASMRSLMKSRRLHMSCTAKNAETALKNVQTVAFPFENETPTVFPAFNSQNLWYDTNDSSGKIDARFIADSFEHSISPRPLSTVAGVRPETTRES